MGAYSEILFNFDSIPEVIFVETKQHLQTTQYLRITMCASGADPVAM